MAYKTEDHETQYCFPAINSSCIKETRSRHEYHIMYMFLSLLSAWTVFLNLLVIISISHFKKLHTPTNLLILSLALSDLLVGLIVIPVEAIKLIESCWYFGHTFCGLFIIIVGTLLTTSLSNLVLIAVDRYVAVCCPLLYSQKVTTARTLMRICFCWICSSAYSSSVVISNGYFDISNRTNVCYGECLVIISFAWRVADLIFTFVFPCTLIITLYLKIFCVAQQQVKVINSLVTAGINVMKESLRRKSESKAALTLGIIVAFHLLSWIPYCIMSVTQYTQNTFTALHVLIWTLYVNSGMNPLVYAFFYRWFKISVKHILTLQIFQPLSSLMDNFTE